MSDTFYLLSALAAVGGCINELPSNGGIAKAKGRWQNGSAYNILIAVVLRCRGSDIQSDTTGVVGNLSSNWINLVEQSITGADLSDTVIC